MRVCDRHKDREASRALTDPYTQEEVDLCDECYQFIRDFIAMPPAPEKPKKAPRKKRAKKDSAKAD